MREREIERERERVRVAVPVQREKEILMNEGSYEPIVTWNAAEPW